jgi:hypothetical protein
VRLAKNRKFQEEPGARGLDRFHAHASPVRLDALTHEAQSNPDARLFPPKFAAQAMERFENPASFRLGNARTRIGHRDRKFPGPRAASQPHLNPAS